MSAAVILAIGGIGVGAIGVLLAARALPAAESGQPILESAHRRSPSGRFPLVPAAAVTAVVVVLVTRWPVAGAMAAVAAVSLPKLRHSTSGSGGAARTEAVAVWTELLRDTLAAAAGLSQAVMATAGIAPKVIRSHVQRLSERLASGSSMEDALRQFASELDDPSGDAVACALLLASGVQSQRLGDLLGALAESCREEVSMRLRVETSRASSRSSVRTVVVFSLGFAGLLLLVARSYLAPFGSLTGQLVLAAVGGCYGAGIWLMVRMVRPRPAVRLLGTGGPR